MTACNTGPFNQTLFLGASVSDFNLSLAWGGESSSCTIKLVRDNSHHPLDPSFGPMDTSLDTTNANTNVSTAFNNLINPSDASKSLTRNISQKLRADNNDATNTQKRCWDTNNITQYFPWTKPDPGFLGEAYNIIGCPAYFKFHEIEFGGYIKKWTANPNGTYDVELNSFASLLRGCKLILRKYRGSISKKINTTEGIVSVPYGDTSEDSFDATILQGNVPNVFNIYGYLENTGFLNSGASELGISALVVYNALTELLGPPSPNRRNQFSPYGAIITKTPSRKDTGKIVNPLEEFLKYKLDTVDSPNAPIQGRFVYGNSTDVAGIGEGLDLTKHGLLKAPPAVDKENRCQFLLDISQVPAPPLGVFLDSDDISIIDFIEKCCEGAGCNYFISLKPSNNAANISGIIVVNIVSRRQQPPPQILRNFFQNGISAGDKVLSYSIGEEFSDQDVRSIVVGGPQERLYQVACNTLSKFRSYHRFNPINGNRIQYTDIAAQGGLNTANLRLGSAHNVVRVPLAHVQRWYNYAFLGGALVAQNPINSYDATFSVPYNSTRQIVHGAYETSTPVLGSYPERPYPIYADLISPYFGRDHAGNVRKVYFDTAASQLQIHIPAQDIASFFPIYAPLHGDLIVCVWENEIRAALSGFDAWITYIFEMTKAGFIVQTAATIMAYLQNTYGSNIATRVFMGGLGILKTAGKMSALPSSYHTGNSVNPGSALIYGDAIIEVLQKLHGFFQDLGSKHYGKEFLVRMPNVMTKEDSARIRQYDYEITDSGWEEFGNTIDDTMVIGSHLATSIANEDGKFGAILGYNNIAEYRHPPVSTINVGGAMSPEELKRVVNAAGRQGAGDEPSLWYMPLQPEISQEDLYYVDYTTPQLPGIEPATFGGARVTTSINGDISYTSSLGEMNPPEGMKYKVYARASTVDVAPENKYNKKILYTNDMTYCVVSAGKMLIRSPRSLNSVMMEDVVLDLKKQSAIPPNIAKHNRYMVLLSLAENELLQGVINALSPSEKNVEIHPRAALPCFAAIPVRYNRFTYGPWVSHPGLIKNLIFPNAVANLDDLVNNIVGGVKVEIDPGLVPWSYGGIDFLDRAVLTRISEDNNYQQILENGSITVAGMQFVGASIGSRLVGAGYGPVINNIGVSIGEDGLKTTYTLRTYSRKLGFFNKENAENIARIGRESLKRRKEIADNYRTLTLSATAGNTSSDFSSSRPKALNWSPVSVLVGRSYPFLHSDSTLTDTVTQLGFNPQWQLRPRTPGNIASTPKNMIQQPTQAAIYDPGELPSFFKETSYTDMSVMSIDGLLSPVSFYPNPYGSTYPMTPYPRSKCPYCNNGTFSYNYFTSSILKESSTPTTLSALRSNFLTTQAPCGFCVPDEQKTDSYTQSSRPSESFPPFIIASGTDLTIINRINNNDFNNSAVINAYTLNPMVMSNTNSEFSCKQNKQNNDACGHSISTVAFGNDASKSLTAAISQTIDSNYADNNVRFFGLRGPLIVHGWGYDTEGYPVPNASGEFKFNSNGTILRKTDGTPLYKNQVLQEDGTWSAPYKENSFFRSWAQLPSIWPVGPIDLRWDHATGMWTIGANYKSVWVVLENDLNSAEPVRGTILEGYSSNSPLPSGFRKLVFVKDGSRLFSAPRGGAIYCKYNGDNGFYEPIYNQPFITSGTIIGNSLVTIYKAYNSSQTIQDTTELRVAPTITPPDATPETYNTNFINPLNLNASINSMGLFIYLNGNWVLQSSKC